MPGENGDEPCNENGNYSSASACISSSTVALSVPEEVESDVVHNERVDTVDAIATEDAIDCVNDLQPTDDPVTVAEVQTAIENDEVENKSIPAPDINPQTMSKRKFRITGLYYPGDDISYPEIMETMLAAQSFHLWFERDPHKLQCRKKGGLSFSFDDESSARQAYAKLKGLVVKGVKWRIHAPKSFDDIPVQEQKQQEPVAAETLPREDPECFQKLYVDQLVPSADQDLIYAIFGKDNLKNVEMRLDQRKSDGSKCAILTFHDRETAEQAKLEYDEFTVDDGDVSRPMRILLYVDHLNKLESDRLRKRVTSSASSVTALNEHIVDDAEPGRRQSHEQKGRAGNLWSAQISQNRGESVETTNNKTNHGRVDTERHGSSRSVSTSGTELVTKGDTKFGTNDTESDTVVVDSAAAAAAAAAAAPPPPPPLSGQDKHDVVSEQEQQSHTSYRPPSRAAGEMAAYELALLIEATMERGRINWAELNTLEDLWTLVHQASKDAGCWQPELSLKESMAVVLDRAYRNASADWQRDHIGALIKMWKKELDTDARSQIRKQMQLSETTTETPADPNDGVAATAVAGIDYTPLPLDKPKKRRNKATKKALMHMMGVAAVLADVKKDAEEEEVKKSAASTKNKKKAQEYRKRKHSASESGEASTTTEDEAGDDDETSNWEEGTASSSEFRRNLEAGKQIGSSHLPPKQQQRKKHTLTSAAARPADDSRTRAPSSEQFSSWMSSMMQTMNAGSGNVQQQWMAQMMPMMLQMMPMVAQMVQAQRVMTAASASVNQTQQQQQMQQQLMQMMQQAMGASMNQSFTPNPQPQQQQANPMSPWTQPPALQPAVNRSGGSASVLPPSTQHGTYFSSHYHQPPPPPPVGSYGPPSYNRRGEQNPMFPVRGHYASR